MLSNYLTAVKRLSQYLKTFAMAILITRSRIPRFILVDPYGLLLSTCIAYAYI